jgi:hypothetical protein
LPQPLDEEALDPGMVPGPDNGPDPARRWALARAQEKKRFPGLKSGSAPLSLAATRGEC